ncbi:MAG TPA: SCO family protein [Parvularculaceae bacterium]|nr:SCO family protein [Parvularculaceae bacterium]
MSRLSGKIQRRSWGKTVEKTARLVIVAAFLAAGACAKSSRLDNQIAADIIKLPEVFSSEFTLVDQDGKPVANTDYAGKVMLVYFGYTHCPDVCPLSLGTISAALGRLTEKQQAEIAPLFISVDPERDTPKVMKAFLSFDPRLIGLTGSEEQIQTARNSFKVAARTEKLPNSALGYEIQHSSLFYIVDRTGKPIAAVRGSASPDELAEILRRGLKGSLT